MVLHFRRVIGIGTALSLATLVAAAGSSCNSSSGAKSLDQSCSINSDCNSPLICAFSKCHDACTESRDCPSGERCVLSGTTGVCQLPAEALCAAGTPCETGEVCGADLQCRVQCTTTGGCVTGDYCLTSGATGACYSSSTPADESTLISEGILSADGAVIGDASTVALTPDGSVVASMPDGASGIDGSNGTASGTDGASVSSVQDGSTGDGSDATVATNPCPDPQLTFGTIGQGDYNQYFTSAVGARTSSELLIFSGYFGPDPAGDGGGTSVQLVYVQAFDAATAASKGPATALFTQGAPGHSLAVQAAAVAPSGQIAILYTLAGINQLYATFLGPAADAGAAGLTVLGSAELTTSFAIGDADPAHVIWSNATQSFVFSWFEQMSFEKIAMYSVTGGQNAGAVAAVSTDNGVTTGDPGSAGEGSVGFSGSLLASEWVSGIAGGTQLGITTYSTLGAQVGGITYVAPKAEYATLAGTASGFVLVHSPEADGLTTTGVFIPTTATGLADAGAFPTYTIPGGTSHRMRAISDDVGTGGAGGVGVALMTASATSFAYVHADGVTFDGPVSVFGTGYHDSTSEISLTNFNGSFVVTRTGGLPPAMGGVATQIAASGCK
jgi:hypothetical protein